MPEVLDRETIKAISTDTRQDIMKMLAKRPYTASEISKITGKHVTTVTEHLVVLEKSGLIRKRESTNKWVYYELTDKGEHLFKPQFYSWVVVLSLSVVFMFVGFLRLFEGSIFLGAQSAAPMAERMLINSNVSQDVAQKTAASGIAPAAQTLNASAITQIDFIAIGLIVLGLIGLAYLLYRKYGK
jgi:DNA-binding transcriptional ArsR family regulator